MNDMDKRRDEIEDRLQLQATAARLAKVLERLAESGRFRRDELPGLDALRQLRARLADTGAARAGSDELADIAEFLRLLERSSLGTPASQRIRQSPSPHVVADILARTDELLGKGGSAAKPPEIPAYSWETIRVVVIEDPRWKPESSLHHWLRSNAGHGIEVDSQVSRDVAGLVKYADRLKGGGWPDRVVVLLDIERSATIREVTELGHRPVALALTTAATPTQVLDAIAAGAKGVLAELPSRADVLGAIETVSAGETYLSASAAEVMIDYDAVRHPGRHRDDELSSSEVEVLRLVAAGHPRYAITARLGISESTVRSCLDRARDKVRHQRTIDLAAEATGRRRAHRKPPRF